MERLSAKRQQIKTIESASCKLSNVLRERRENTSEHTLFPEEEPLSVKAPASWAGKEK